MKQLRLPIFFFATLTLLVFACSTDVELNAPYKNTPVIFALLDPDPNGDNVSNSLDTQWVDIDRTFMGEGDNNVYAGIFDSVEYKNEDFIKRVVQKLEKGGSNPIEEYPLIDVIRPRVTGGVFPAQNQVYYFLPPASGLSHEHDYRLLLQFRDGVEVSAVTDIVAKVGSNFCSSISYNNMITLAQWNPSDNDVKYTTESTIQFFPPQNSVSIEVSMALKYIENKFADESQSGTPSSEEKIFSYSLGRVERTSGTNEKLVFDASGFFTSLKNSLIYSPNYCREIGSYSNPEGGVTKTRCFEFKFAMSNAIFNDYINSNSLNISVAQERPMYTNVNNGIGLFASRSTKSIVNVPLYSAGSNGILNLGNLDALVRAQNLLGYNFCDPNPTSDYACPCAN